MRREVWREVTVTRGRAAYPRVGPGARRHRASDTENDLITHYMRAFGPEPDAIAHRKPTLSADESAVFPMRVDIVTMWLNEPSAESRYEPPRRT